jgi:magnesium chelatase family protein
MSKGKNMISIVHTASIKGLTGELVRVETYLTNQIPGMQVSGLASQTIKESKDRVRAAIRHSGFKFPNKKITVNLVPAANRKEGSHFDLPLAIGVLVANQELDQKLCDDIAFIGELSLDGTINSVKGALPLVIGLRDAGFSKVIIPLGNCEEASLVPNVKIYGVKNLGEVVEVVNQAKDTWHNNYPSTPIPKSNNMDYQDVRGQEAAKRAITISVAGGHGILMMGFPGSGKTMLAKRIPTIMPAMNREESLEVTKIYSVAGELTEEEPLVRLRPFREPHHTISATALLGGGNHPKPGELSLAHQGVLFLDEFPEFPRKVLEMLRQPLETRSITIARALETVVYPCNILLVAASNPCKCGYYGDHRHKCTCTLGEIQHYQSKISGPLLDRIDLQIDVPSVSSEELWEEKNKGVSTGSKEMHQAVERARSIQKKRYNDNLFLLNGYLAPNEIKKYCPVKKEGQELLKMAFERLGLSFRAYHKILKVARTIADLEDKAEIETQHIAEALQYRKLDRELESEI